MCMFQPCGHTVPVVKYPCQNDSCQSFRCWNGRKPQIKLHPTSSQYPIISYLDTKQEKLPKIKISTCIGGVTIKNTWIPFLKLFEQIGEALPQFMIALTFYVNHKSYVDSYDTLFGSSIPITLVSIVFSGVSVSIGVLTGLRTFKQMYDEGEGMFKKDPSTPRRHLI